MEELYAKVRMGLLERMDGAQAPIPGAASTSNVTMSRREAVAAAAANSAEQKEAIKVYLKSDAYKTLVLSSKSTASEVTQLMAEKLNLGIEFSKYFDVVERVKKGEQYMERKLDANANLFDLRAKWPMIFGPTGNETQLYCRFIINVKGGTPENAQRRFREAAFGEN